MPKLNPPPQSLPSKITQDAGLLAFFQPLLRTIYQNFYALNLTNPNNTTADITADGGITPDKRLMRVQGSGGAVTVTATPSIAAMADGWELILKGDSDTNTLKLQDESNLASSGLALAGAADFTLGKGDILHLYYDANDSKWYEISRSNN